MWHSENWSDYELLDTSDGERLERWGDLILIRPDPQIIWRGVARHPAWKHADGIYRRSSTGGGAWVKNHLPQSWNISYGDLKFVLRPMGFKHTGLFPEQAANWDWFSDLIRRANRPIRVLNLFAYTGGATVAAAAAGASVVHVDASKGIVAQAKENAALSGLEKAPIRYLVDDCKKLVEREIRRGNTYEGIIMDPPSYGRGPNGEVWKIEDSIDELITLASRLLSDDPLFFLVNSYTTGLSPMTMNYLLDLKVRARFGGVIESGELGLPVTQTGGFLPCGASSRWYREQKGDRT
ncbi:MAG: class I SAM-dependent methyltransferase [Clostridia bacterium]|nr:class I SAM-dependent methyltransferase [Clostridia bacterium]